MEAAAEPMYQQDGVNRWQDGDDEVKQRQFSGSPNQRSKGSIEGRSPSKGDHKRNYTTYTCQSCSRVDLQLSICLKAIHFLLNRHEHGYTDTLEEFDPIVKKLYMDRGFKEHRRFPESQPSHPKLKGVNSQEAEEMKDNSSPKFSVVSFYLRSSCLACRIRNFLAIPRQDGQKPYVLPKLPETRSH